MLAADGTVYGSALNPTPVAADGTAALGEGVDGVSKDEPSSYALTQLLPFPIPSQPQREVAVEKDFCFLFALLFHFSFSPYFSCLLLRHLFHTNGKSDSAAAAAGLVFRRSANNHVWRLHYPLVETDVAKVLDSTC